MARPHRTFYKWHIWLGWLVGVPLILWTASGLFMVIRPIEEVRGEHLRLPVEMTALPASRIVPLDVEPESVKSATIKRDGSQTIWQVEKIDGNIERYEAESRTLLPRISEAQAQDIVGKRIRGGDDIADIAGFEDGRDISDFRRPLPVWRVTLDDGTNIYVDQRTGDIAAVRTQFWRAFDFMWGLHIMDLQTREDTSHPILIGSAALALMGSILGFVMLFTRLRKRRRTKA